MAPQVFEYEFDTPVFKGKTSIPTGIYINGEFVPGSSNELIDVVNPTTGKVITQVSIGSPKDVDIAVKAAQKAFDTVWGLNAPGTHRARLLNKLADLIEANYDELAAVESLDTGKPWAYAKAADVKAALSTIRYYAGWADKIQGKTIELTNEKLAYTRHEPIGVVGQIIPWNFPIMILCWKIGPALATGNCVILKPSEFTPLTALLMAKLVHEAGFPPGVVNIINGTGAVVGQAITDHMEIEKISFTGSTLVGRKVMEAAAKSNLKNVTLELGGKSPNIIFNDANLPLAVDWAIHGIFFNAGQACSAGSRIYVQSQIYDAFLKEFTARVEALNVGDPFQADSFHGPQVSKIQFDRIMSYIDSGKKAGATVHVGGERLGSEGWFIKPTIFTNVHPDMKIVREEIFGPVGVIIKFEDAEDMIRQANDSVYGLAASIFTQDITCALNTAHKLLAGSVWINCTNSPMPNVPFGGYKQSGIGRDLGEHALDSYTAIKAVHVNLGGKL